MAATATAEYRQEMPPKGGYPQIKYKRNLPVRFSSGLAIILGGTAVMTAGLYVVIQTNKERRRLQREKLQARIALLPLLQAEQDRKVLRSLCANEEAEAAIMKDVKDWKVGESVYHTKRWVPPDPNQLKQL
ncbi:NADH dehydrogenase [ubiquinone] 1 alpha subcomplex subunit 13-like [Oscarella lobularis]|uniref:NADH dehydrogenase [ubiquinone] 1 alpha subcomplex subunit 13-like n=1 Tax=Oscarella lobularis TaxID=121494 RepID=UPI003313DC45